MGRLNHDQDALEDATGIDAHLAIHVRRVTAASGRERVVILQQVQNFFLRMRFITLF
jgi:hypothetical protein